MNINWLSRQVARASKECRPERGGIAINIWPDGGYSTSVWRGNSDRRQTADGEWMDRLAVIDWPVTATVAKEIISAAMAERMRGI